MVAHLHAQGVPIKQIVRRTGVARNAVRRWIRAGEAAPYRRAPAPSRLDRYLPFVVDAWRHGQRNAAAIWRALLEQGFEGGYDIVRRWMKRQRIAGEGQPDAAPPSWRVPSSRRATRLLTCDPATLSQSDRRFVDTLRTLAPEIRAVADLITDFCRLIRGQGGGSLTAWLEAASTTALRGFAQGLRADRAAVQAAMTEPWSNGPVEGQINRLKLIKRQMYGRAKFDLLRQRVLCAA